MPVEWDMYEFGSRQYGEALLGVGLFHGSVFGLRDWGLMEPVLAFVVNEAGADRPSRVVVDAWTGDVLHVVPATFRVNIDLWEDVVDYDTCFSLDWSEEGCLPVGPVRLDSQQLCGLGTYPQCTYWPGHSADLWSDVETMLEYMDVVLDRTSWDDLSMDHCGGEIDPFRCCQTHQGGPFDISAMNTVGPLPYDDDAAGNAMFSTLGCHSIFGKKASCPSVVAHEFGHGIDFAEKGLLTDQYKSESTAKHAPAMAEGLADVIGIGFKHLYFPGQGSPWVLNDERVYCDSEARDLATPTSDEANHASRMWRGPQTDHWNSLVVGHAFYLLGRSPSDGAVSHYGVSVTGIGIEKALQIFYRAMTLTITDAVPRSLSDLRSALLSTAGSLYGYSSTEYNATRNVVDAMGYWTGPSYLPQRFSGRPEFGRFGSWSNQLLRYPTIVFKDGGTLKYRYRYLSGFSYVWTSPATIASSAGAFQTVSKLRFSGWVPVGYDFHVFYQNSSNYLRHWVRRSSGETYNWPVVWTGSGNPVQMRSGSEFRIVWHDGSDRIFMTEVDGTTGAVGTTVRSRDLNVESHTVTDASVETTVPWNRRFEVGSDGTSLHIFHWQGPGHTLQQRKLVGGAYESVSSGTRPFGDYAVHREFDVASFNNSIHVVLDDARLYSSMGLLYSRCDGGCDELQDWSRTPPIRTEYPDDEELDFISLGVYFLPDGGLTLIRQSTEQSLMAEYETKYSK